MTILPLVFFLYFLLLFPSLNFFSLHSIFSFPFFFLFFSLFYFLLSSLSLSDQVSCLFRTVFALLLCHVLLGCPLPLAQVGCCCWRLLSRLRHWPSVAAVIARPPALVDALATRSYRGCLYLRPSRSELPPPEYPTSHSSPPVASAPPIPTPHHRLPPRPAAPRLSLSPSLLQPASWPRGAAASRRAEAQRANEEAQRARGAKVADETEEPPEPRGATICGSSPSLPL